MKGLIKYALMAVLATEVAAGSHRHRHRHIKREKVAAVQQVQISRREAGNKVVVYEEIVKDEQGNYHKQPMDPVEAQRCLDDGSCATVEETFNSPQAAPPPMAETKTTDAVFEPTQQPSTSSSQVATLPTPSPSLPPPPPPAPTTDSPAPAPQSASSSAAVLAPSVPAPSTGNDRGDDGGKEDLKREFPSGQLACSQFPEGYGPVRTDWHMHDGWSGIQNVPDYQPGSNKPIVQIRTAPRGEACTKNSMCSYACPSGWQKSQWPPEQGSEGESVGGIYCDSNGKLQLTRPSWKTLCQKGVGGVRAENKLKRDVVLCRTDYPGTEKMGLPTVVRAGEMAEITNPKQAEFLYHGNKTSAHLYVNPAGVEKENACLWHNDDPALRNTTGDNAPVVFGVGYDEAIETSFLSIASNNMHSAINFKVHIYTTDGSMKRSLLCEYEEPNPTAGKPCTVSVAKGHEAIFSFVE